jgi:hypothetical protein
MKKILVISLMSCMLWAFSSHIIMAQCNTTELSKNCIESIQEGFIFIKNFSVDGQDGQIQKLEYSYIFAKDTKYFLNLVNSEGSSDGIVVTISDSRRKEITRNYVNGKFFPAIIFDCKSTGIYYLTYTFEGSGSDCASSALAFKKM